MKSTVYKFFVLLVVVGSGIFIIMNYSWVFAKRVQGEIVEVERVTAPTAILGQTTEQQAHSYAVAIMTKEGHIYTASSEDRQWSVAKKGYCVDALLYRYPPWNLEKGGTFFNARVDQLMICPGKNAETKSEESAPMESAPPKMQSPNSENSHSSGTSEHK